ncbi:MAG: hypothetical protein RL380_859, partial [Verrucomicrobiota bacterium]
MNHETLEMTRNKKLRLSVSFSCVLCISWLKILSAAEIHVAPGTNDFATLTAAQRQARQQLRLSNETSQIILHGGNYFLTQPLQFHAEDSGTTITAAPGEPVVLSGAVQITGWLKARRGLPGLQKTARDKIWVADAPLVGGRTLEFRQLWVGDRKATRACTLDEIPSRAKDAKPAEGKTFLPSPPSSPSRDTLPMPRLVALDKTNQTFTVPLAALGSVRDAAHLELIVQQIWEIAVLRVKSITVHGDTARLTFHQPESKLEFEHPWPPPSISTNGNSTFFLANRLEFLDAPGEWFEDLAAGKIYYWPRAEEDLATAKVFAPALETLVEISGTADAPVENISFKNISFAHTSWLRPSRQGHVPLQAGMF